MVRVSGFSPKKENDAAARLGSRRGPSLASHMIGGSGNLADPEGKWQDAYGVGPDSAVLVRPDGYVGWRGRRMAEDAGRILAHALDRILARC